MITPAFIFTAFMLTLGPIKVTPAFFMMTQGQTPEAARGRALKGTLAAEPDRDASGAVDHRRCRHRDISGRGLDIRRAASRLRGGCGGHLAAQSGSVPAQRVDRGSVAVGGNAGKFMITHNELNRLTAGSICTRRRLFRRRPAASPQRTSRTAYCPAVRRMGVNL